MLNTDNYREIERKTVHTSGKTRTGTLMKSYLQLNTFHPEIGRQVCVQIFHVFNYYGPACYDSSSREPTILCTALCPININLTSMQLYDKRRGEDFFHFRHYSLFANVKSNKNLKKKSLFNSHRNQKLPLNLAGKKMSVAGFHIAVSIPFRIPKYLHNYRMQDCYNGKKK